VHNWKDIILIRQEVFFVAMGGRVLFFPDLSSGETAARLRFIADENAEGEKVPRG
jgi:hypothetical protein